MAAPEGELAFILFYFIFSPRLCGRPWEEAGTLTWAFPFFRLRASQVMAAPEGDSRLPNLFLSLLFSMR
jgi:hypothetical protein